MAGRPGRRFDPGHVSRETRCFARAGIGRAPCPCLLPLQVPRGVPGRPPARAAAVAPGTAPAHRGGERRAARRAPPVPHPRLLPGTPGSGAGYLAWLVGAILIT